jgi:hypothetical protein
MTLMKGAFVVFGTDVPVPTDIIMFQFNSETLVRKVDPPKENQPNAGAATRGSNGNSHQTRQPTETLTVAIELDAADQLQAGDALATSVGLHPGLAQIELLMYPSSTILLLNQGLALAGIATITPSKTPLVLFVWGTTRVLPVHVTSVQITEQQFDDRLNPITARAEIGLTVLNPEDLSGAFATLAMVTQIAKEGLAKAGTVGSALNVSSLLPF